MIPEFDIPTRVHFGPGSLKELRPPAGRTLFVVSASLPEAIRGDLVERWLSLGIEAVTVVKPTGEPQSADVDRVALQLGLLDQPDFESVVGLGGGSVLDFAKGLSVIAGSGGSITDYEFGHRKIDELLPLYLAPTTCGSGSEVTPYAVFTNSGSERKFTLTHPDLRAVEASVDSDLLRSLPPRARMATALDAFTHCLEAILNKTNPGLALPVAQTGLVMAWERLNPETRPWISDEHLDDLAELSVRGGISIARSRTGLIHTLSVAFSSLTNVPHGVLNAHLLPFALSHNLDGFKGLLAEVVSGMVGGRLTSDELALEVLTVRITELVGAPLPFSKESVCRDEDSLVARLLQDSGLPSVSHGDITASSLRSLVRRIAHAA